MTKRLVKLTQPALVVSARKNWGPEAMNAGSVVELLPATRSPLTEDESEHYVRWVDIIGRETEGWLARTTAFTPVKSSLPLVNIRGELSLSPLDQLRNAVAMTTFRDQEPWTIARWCCTFGSTSLDLLKSVARELGSRVPDSAPETTVIERTLRSILNREVKMSDTTKPSPAAKKAPAKKTTATEKAPARSMARTTSVAAVDALTKAGAPKNVVALAKKLEGGELTKKQLIELRDGVNAAASAAREANQNSVASKLSSVNRLVRRLARKA